MIFDGTAILHGVAEMKVLEKEVEGTGMPWETAYGYAQAVRVGDMKLADDGED